MAVRWRAVTGVVIVSASLAACGGAADAGASQESASGLPIAAAPSPVDRTDPPADFASEPMPEWREPEDPIVAYRVLMDKVAYMRRQPSLEVLDEIYAPNSRMALERDNVERAIKKGERRVDGRTVIEDIDLLSLDNDTAFLRVRAREEGWVSVDANGNRTADPRRCEEYVVELRDAGEGWRIATLIVDERKGERRCDA